MASAIVYVPVADAVTITFKRGPVGFRAFWAGRVHDNVASSGAARERVVENLDLMVGFQMPHLVIGDDIEAWTAFAKFALMGNDFKFYPAASLDYWFNCVWEGEEFGPTWTAPKKYGQAIQFRVLQDAQTPAGPDAVLRRFYGINS